MQLWQQVIQIQSFKYIPGYYAFIYLYILYKHTVVGI